MSLKEVPLSLRLKNIAEGFKPLYRLSYTERCAKREALMSHNPLTNTEIWFNLIKDVGSITEADVSRITTAYQTYLEVFPDDEPTVATILDFASNNSHRQLREKVQKLSGDSFYDKVCFNYRRGIDADKRFWEDSQKYWQGERLGLLISKTDEEYWNVREMIEYDLSSLMGRISKSEVPDPKNPEIERIIDPESIGSELTFSLKGASERNYNSDLKKYYVTKIIPLLESDEVIVPIEPSRWQEYCPPPRIRYSFSNQTSPLELKPMSEELKALI